MKNTNKRTVRVSYWYSMAPNNLYHLKFSETSLSFSICQQTLVSRVTAEVMRSVLPVVNCALTNLSQHQFNHAYAPPKTSGTSVLVHVWNKKTIVVHVLPGVDLWTLCINGKKVEFKGPFPFEFMATVLKLTRKAIEQHVTPH